MRSESIERGERDSSWPKDRKALAAALPQYLPLLARYTRRRFRRQFQRRESPTDVVQSACGEVLRNLSRFDDFGEGETAFRQWLFRTTERKLIDHERYHLRERRNIARETPSASGSQLEFFGGGRASNTPSRAAIRCEHRQQLLAALSEMPPHYRDVIRRMHLDGESAESVARQTGWSRAAVHSRLARAMARLAQELRKRLS